MDADVRGGEDFYRLSKALKAAGQTELRKELNKSLRVAAKPLIPKTRAAARRDLPQKGGLAERVAKAPQRVRVSTGAATAGVSIVMPGAQPGYEDGVIKHPVFAKKGRKASKWSKRKDGTVADYGGAKWVTQRVDGDWFDDTIRDDAPQIRRAIGDALEDMAQRIVREVR